MNTPPSSSTTLPPARGTRIQPSRTRRGGPGVGSSEIDQMILDNMKRKSPSVEGDPLIPTDTPFLATTNSAAFPLDADKSSESPITMNIYANERYFERPEVIKAYREQAVIETPSFIDITDKPSVGGRFRPRDTDAGIPDTSDAAYEKRHRRYEKFEKRLRLREKEKLKHEQYKLTERIEQLRSMDGNAFMALPAEAFSSRFSKSQLINSDGDGGQSSSEDEAERRRTEMLDVAYSLKERYRLLLPPDRVSKPKNDKTSKDAATHAKAVDDAPRASPVQKDASEDEGEPEPGRSKQRTKARHLQSDHEEPESMRPKQRQKAKQDSDYEELELARPRQRQKLKLSTPRSVAIPPRPHVHKVALPFSQSSGAVTPSTTSDIVKDAAHTFISLTPASMSQGFSASHSRRPRGRPPKKSPTPPWNTEIKPKKASSISSPVPSTVKTNVAANGLSVVVPPTVPNFVEPALSPAALISVPVVFPVNETTTTVASPFESTTPPRKKPKIDGPVKERELSVPPIESMTFDGLATFEPFRASTEPGAESQASSFPASPVMAEPSQLIPRSPSAWIPKGAMGSISQRAKLGYPSNPFFARPSEPEADEYELRSDTRSVDMASSRRSTSVTHAVTAPHTSHRRRSAPILVTHAHLMSDTPKSRNVRVRHGTAFGVKLPNCIGFEFDFYPPDDFWQDSSVLAHLHEISRRHNDDDSAVISMPGPAASSISTLAVDDTFPSKEIHEVKGLSPTTEPPPPGVTGKDELEPDAKISLENGVFPTTCEREDRGRSP
ncbi:hypothetical protein FISHEDRAFT_56826 [Fistulina hepatica ATCC 64428]|uniref:PEHE domain-containing protein n=1 Tax=Fistulina hepatica ATCC 64428 TaxID=1128425 RepID=A0A0D7AHG6_9AGAR|nr:hypothetical protein FISHEDRAFT_56826 [Fistulina hepatica ATCC 64428]